MAVGPASRNSRNGHTESRVAPGQGRIAQPADDCLIDRSPPVTATAISTVDRWLAREFTPHRPSDTIHDQAEAQQARAGTR